MTYKAHEIIKNASGKYSVVKPCGEVYTRSAASIRSAKEAINHLIDMEA